VSIAASVLDCFAAHRELGATQVARELGVAKSTACRMLSALAERLTTHVGSLARPHDLLELMREKEHGRPYDPQRFAGLVREAVSDVVRGQVAAGLDVITDGEQPRAARDSRRPDPAAHRYGLNHGPRLNDIPLADVVPVMLRINAVAYSFEVANPRHQHEWRIWADTPLPDGEILLPGLLGHPTNYVEHPELIADSVCAYAGLVGRENVIASADCGFSSRATFAPEVHPTVVWAKFAALAEGAAIATKRLWGGN
jgi:methionine synthase II (cobalamin-independent)